MSDVISSAFKEANGHYASAQRWAGMLVVVLLVLHVTTFSQYLRTDRDLKAVSRQTEALARTKAALDELDARTTALRDVVNAAIAGTFGGPVVNALREDFRRLSEEIVGADASPPPIGASDNGYAGPSVGGAPLAPPPPASGGQGGLPPQLPPAADHGSQFVGQVPIQMQMMQRPLLSPEEKEAILKLRGEGPASEDQLLELLKAPVERSILEPRFAQLGDDWRRRAVDIEVAAKQVQAAAATATGVAGDGKEQVGQVSAAAGRISQAAKQLKVAAPPGEWWGTVAGKELMIGILQASAEAELADDVSERMAGQLRQASEQAHDDAAKLQSTLATELELVKGQFAEQQKQAADLAKPLGLLSVDAGFFVSRFPLLLGLGTGLSLLWLAERRARLARVYTLAAERDPDVRLLGRISSVTAMGQARDATWAAGGAATWVAVASLQLAAARAVTVWGGIVLFLAALLPVAIAVAYARRAPRGS